MDDRAPSLLRFDRFTLDLARGCLRRGTEEIPLRPKAYDVLRYLAQRTDCLATKDEIMRAVWPKVFVTDDSLVHCVTELRQALGDRDQRIIRTVPRRGYRFVAPVSAVTDGTSVENNAEPVAASRAAPGHIVARPAWRRWPSPAAILLLLLVVAGGVGGWWWYGNRSLPGAGGPPLSDRPSIAALPFDDLGGDERQKRLADAFAEGLITELARSRDLLVIARNSSFTYKGSPVDVRQVSRELGVRYVLDGSLHTGPERMRVAAQLIDATNGAHLWPERYDRPARRSPTRASTITPSWR